MAGKYLSRIFLLAKRFFALKTLLTSLDVGACSLSRPQQSKSSKEAVPSYSTALKISTNWTSLVVQWLRIRLPCRGHRFGPWSGKIARAEEQLSLCATATELKPQSPCSATRQATSVRSPSPATRVAPARHN